MKMSGKITLHSNEVPSDGVATEVDGDTLELLQNAYKKKIPRFKQLNEEYIIDQRKKRKKLSFCQWVPKALVDGDTELLQGPLNPIYVHKKITVENCNTGRLIIYAPKSVQSSCDHSFVQFSGRSPPTFGCIKMCFMHTFSGHSGRYVLLDVYASSQQDADSKIWWVPAGLQVIEQVVVEVTPIACSLSPPLYTAKDDGKLWFLNAH